MKTTINKVIFYLIGAGIIIMNSTDDTTILLLLVVLSFTSLIELSKNPYWSIGYLLLFFALPEALPFLPLFILDSPKQLLPLSFVIIFRKPSLNLWILSVIALMVRYYSDRTRQLEVKMINIIDENRSQQLNHRDFTNVLNSAHEQALTNATLKERNRIARDIHDSVGHQLSSSIIQLGALRIMNEQSELSPAFDNLETTLNSAMDSIRSSVHHLHNKSIDLESEIDRLLRTISTLEIDYKYHLEQTPRNEIISCFQFIIKEAIHNIYKHSNATSVKIHVSQSLDSIQLLIHDNGTSESNNGTFGMGLNNMRIRVHELKGNFNLQTNQGFRIYCSIPKKEIL